MRHGVAIFVFTLLVTAFYYYVGQLVPQKRVDPPKSADIRADMSVEEMVEAGRIIVEEGKGTCEKCHNGSLRFPDFNKAPLIGARAKTEREGMSDIEYLAEALCQPNTYIVEPFAPGMPAANKPPIGLSTEEVLVTIAYLQSIGAEPTVTMKTDISKFCGAAAEAAAPAADAGGEKKEMSGKELVAIHGCLGCHAIDNPARMVGPSLYDVGKRLSRGELYEAVVDPDLTLTPGFPPLMGATLKGGGFYEKVSSGDLQKMVNYLASLKG